VMDTGRIIASGEFAEVRKSKDVRTRQILSQVLGEIASYDTDLLALLDGGGGDDAN